MSCMRIVLALTLAWGAGASASLPDLIDEVRPAVVGIGTSYPPRQPIKNQNPTRLHATGFAVADGRLIVTNYHALPRKLDTRNNQVLAVFAGRGSDALVHPAEIVATDPEHDLALLRIRAGKLPVVRMGDDALVREGTAIAFTGFPIGAVLGLFPATHRGIVSAVTPVARVADDAGQLDPVSIKRSRNPYLVYQLDATAFPGNSGSPLYAVDSGEVIGIVNSVFVQEGKEAVLSNPSGITYAVPIKFVRQLLISTTE